MKTMSETKDTARNITVTAAQLPVHCPPTDSPLWARHPRVFLDVLKTGQATCPYCSTQYIFSGEKPRGHH
jgi:uncharacterized Zn-finger protein